MDNETLEAETTDAVPTSGDALPVHQSGTPFSRIASRTKAQRATLPADLPPSTVAHRESFMRFVLDEAEPWHRIHLGRLYDRWHEWNEAFFGGQMVAPYIMFSTPSNPRSYGDCGPVSGFGGRSQIRIRASIQRGTHPDVSGWKQSDCSRFVDDILLHEMVHQYAQEVTGERDGGYHGHGPAFRDKANEIGEALGLVSVRTAKVRKPEDKRVPSCSQWPHEVRPAGYYPEEVLPAVRPPTKPRDLVLAYFDTATDEQRRELLAFIAAARLH